MGQQQDFQVSAIVLRLDHLEREVADLRQLVRSLVLIAATSTDIQECLTAQVLARIPHLLT